MSNPEMLSGKWILVVEDEYFLADDIRAALSRAGANIIGPLPSAGEALAKIPSGTRIDAAVLDINLQGGSVYPLADVLIGRGVPVVFATGYDASVIPSGYRALPRWEKPFDPRRLAEALPHLLPAS